MDTTFLLGFVLGLSFAIEVAPMNCSCYSFHADGLTWTAARQSCQYIGGDLVSMETERELQFIKDHVQNLTNLFNNDWHIGLHLNATVAGNWTWLSGKPLTFDRWQPGQPQHGAPYVVMARDYSPGTKGLFKGVRGDILAGFICENPADCPRSSLLCKGPEKITAEFKTTTSTSNTLSSSTPQPQRRNPITTERRALTRATKSSKTVIMVEKVQPPSGFIHWTIAVIPLACVIAVLICVIGFLLWRLKQRPRKQNGDITVNAIHYDVQTRSILNQEGKANNLRGANHTRVHFEEPNNHEDPKFHTFTQAKDNENSAQCVALYTKPGDLPIPRRLAIRRKDSREFKGKYPLNKSGQDNETEEKFEGSYVDVKSYQGDGSKRSSREYHALPTDYDEQAGMIESDQENTEKPDCSEDEVSYLEIIP
ncbi:hypothetical protein ACROYT_G019480 [Oculina patagonica]